MKIEKIEKMYSDLEIYFIIIGFLCFVAWVMFIFCCFIALGSDGPYGAILETGVYIIKNYPIGAILSLVPAIYFAKIIDNL